MKIRPYVSIDIETTGISMDCEVLQISAVYDDFVTPIEELQTLDIKMYYKKFVGEPVAIQMNQKLLNDMAESRKSDAGQITFMNPAHALTVLLPWLNRRHQECLKFDKEQENNQNGRLIIAGKNAASFDIPRIKQFIAKYGTPKESKLFERITSYKVLDPGSMYFSDYGYMPSLTEINKKIGREAVTHNALDDAFDVVYAVRNKLMDV